MSKEINVPLLKQICETPGVPGYEKQIRDLVIAEVSPYVDKVSVDNIGNLVCFKKGKADKKVMIAAHMDEIGFMVNHIDDNGFLRFVPLGGFDPKTLTAQRVVVHGEKPVVGVMGSKPIHIMSADERNKVVTLNDFFIDLGMGKEEVNKIVSLGNPVTRERELIEMGDCVNCKSLDNRVSVFILIEVLKSLKDEEIPYDIYAVFTVQEEVGIRGAQAAALSIQPDFGFGLDTTIAYDVPGARDFETCTKLGAGTAIKLLDASAICDVRMIQFMKKVAKEYNVKHQFEVLTAGGTDTAGIQRMTPGGSICGAVSIPTRHIHQVIEMCNKSDINDSILLLSYCLQDLDKHDWSA